jgi:hypothetical protein
LYGKRDQSVIHELDLGKEPPADKAMKVLEFANRILKNN